MDKIKSTLAEREKLKKLALSSVGEKRSAMSEIVNQMNLMVADDPEAIRLGIKAKDLKWEEFLTSTITGRREALTRTGAGLTEAAKSLTYTRFMKPKIIKALMGEVKSGDLNSTNPKGYAERLKRIHDNFDELMKKEGEDYLTLSRRELGKRVGKVMEPEIKGATAKAKKFATNSKNLVDTFYGNSQMDAALDSAGIKNETARFVTRMLMGLGG